MNADFRVVLDACVLSNFGLCDLFLTLAETPRLYQPVWNREILDEVQRTQTGKLGWPEALSKSWREAVESAFPEAMVTVQASLVAACANQEKDRHVLATAIRGHADLIDHKGSTHHIVCLPDASNGLLHGSGSFNVLQRCLCSRFCCNFFGLLQWGLLLTVGQ